MADIDMSNIPVRSPFPPASGGNTHRVTDLGGDLGAFGESPDCVPAATIAAQRVAEVRDGPHGRLDLLLSS